MRWLVSLTGESADLDRLVGWQHAEDWQIIRHETRGVVLCGSRFEGADSSESVVQIADELIYHIIRSAKHLASDFQGVSRGAIVEQFQDEEKVHYHIHARDGLYVLMGADAYLVKRAPDGTIIETSEDLANKQRASGFPRLVRLQEANSHVADALLYLEQEPNMYGFYKVGEAILRAIGKPKKWDALVVELGWTSDDELWRFTKSTHRKRHHLGKGPQNSMEEREAAAYVRALLDKLITHLESAA